jgi:hypothetical protein
MMALHTLVRWFRCRYGWCFGRTVSGVHDGVVWIGWRCETCGAVKHYEPTQPLRDPMQTCIPERHGQTRPWSEA